MIRLSRMSMKARPTAKKTMTARIEFRMLPVRASMTPKLKVPQTVAIFSVTSKKLKNEVWSSVSGSIFEIGRPGQGLGAPHRQPDEDPGDEESDGPVDVIGVDADEHPAGDRDDVGLDVPDLAAQPGEEPRPGHPDELDEDHRPDEDFVLELKLLFPVERGQEHHGQEAHHGEEIPDEEEPELAATA